MKFAVFLLSVLTICSIPAIADDHDDDKFFPTEREKNTPFFDCGSWTSTAHIAAYGPEDPDNRDIELTLLNIGAERYVWQNLGVVADAFLVAANGDILEGGIPTPQQSNAFGIGGSLGLKWHFFRGSNWSAFVNGNVGMLFTDSIFPAGGTSWNFVERADLGFTVRLRNQLHITVSGSLLHASNGKGLNSDNPSYSGEGGYIGLVYRFDTFGIFRNDED